MLRNRILLSIALLLVQYWSMATAAQTNISTDHSALLALKSHITSDPQNMILTNWSTPSSICNWVGVTCGARHLRVTVLNLSYMGVTGTIPPELGNLSFLVELRFRNNSFHGTIPQELSRLRLLKILHFGFNNFKGTIPSWLGAVSKLQNVSLHGNQFSGLIPTNIFNLSAVQRIDLRFNQLSGSIPREIGNLTMLKAIGLDSNNLRGIPNEIGTLDQLEQIFVQDNALEGYVPGAIFNMSSLTALVLTGNSLNGRLPDNICQHLPSIQQLYLGENQFVGPLPSKLWQCKELAVLDLSSNNVNGSIPKNIGNLTQIKVIHLGSNNLTGTIPDEIGDIPNLEFLALGFNNLNGLIPSRVFNMSTIQTLSLIVNDLSGSLPVNIGLGVPNLQLFLVSGNELSGLIPNFISNASKIRTLDMSMNSFSGFIPSTVCALENLQWLNIALNHLTIDTSSPEVNFLSCLATLRDLRRLSLSDNPLNTSLPASNRNLSRLESIYLSNTNMRGGIPSDIGNMSSLIALYLGYNQLSGPIQTTMGSLKNLQGLYLNDNQLQGHIPYELCQLENLVDLLLGGNQLSGSIPSCLGDLATALRTLSLNSNLLTSTIPSTLWRLNYILHINLSSNSLIGLLSEDIGNLKVVTDIDLSSNHLSGIIPGSIGGLQDLVNLSLASNTLEGPIPTSFGNMLSLELLDLSQNNLSGEIPKSLEALLHLSYLNLSFNRLRGEIPTGGPFRNFSAQSFVSNSALCGAPQLHIAACKNRTIKLHSTKARGSILKYVIPGIMSVILLVTSISMLILRRKRHVEVARETTLWPQLQWRRVSYQELRTVTNGFNESNLLGSGGFGSVYKGTLSDGINVAIKVFNLQLEGAFTSFDTECEMLGSIRHRNLIKIISCCSQIDFKAVVLDYMPNGSLEKWLYSQNFCLNILQRLNIMIDVASALEYLHHGTEIPIVHCDLKPSNILVDDDMVGHVADFGIAKLLGGGDSMSQTMTLATIGYMAPEYGTEGVVTRRGDVYSFGVVLMETFTKRKPTDEMFVGEASLKQWVANSLLSGAIIEVGDANLLGTENDFSFVSKTECLSSIMRLALSCCAESPEGRINMQDAVVTLNKIMIKFLKDAAGGVVLRRPLAQ
ncbi:putative LRR receptor-like serine/threonine-protein kinase [Rosa sericea]